MMTLTSIADATPSLLAYLDPGSGSMLLQIMIAGLFSGAFVLKSSFATVRGRVTRLFKRGAVRA